MHEQEYINWISNHPPELCPCHGCPMADHCRVKAVACLTFAKYASKDFGKHKNKNGQSSLESCDVDKPTREVYNLIYCGLEAPPKALTKRALKSVRRQNNEHL